MQTIQTTWTWLNRTWCSLTHPAPLWPIHGEYRCPECFRTYRVAWETNTHAHAKARPQ